MTIRDYAQHKPDCDWHKAQMYEAPHPYSSYACSCGLDEALRRVEELEDKMRHVINDSPGTPDAVKRYLARALAADLGREDG